jgi:hypothetical protein
MLTLRDPNLTPDRIEIGMNQPRPQRLSLTKTAPAALLFAVLTMATATAQQTNEIGFIERFALAEDRSEVLKELIPGTEDYYFFHALHYQNIGNQAGLGTVIAQWKKRFENSGRRKEIENRQALITYETDPKTTLDYLKRELGLKFNHQRERKQTNPNLPTALDQSLIALDAIVKRSLSNDRSLGEVSDTGIDWLMQNWSRIDLSTAQKRELLGKLQRPDYPDLVDALAEDFGRRESRGFEEFPVNRLLLLSQLDALAAKRPQLLGDSNFVLTKLGKLRPGADVDMEQDKAAKEAYLDRAWAFASELEPAFNSLVAHLLYQRLSHDLAKGDYDKDRFLAYLKLPRPVHYMNPKYREDLKVWRHQVDMNFDCSSATSFPPIGREDQVVRGYLLHFLTGASDYKPYSPYLTDEYLKTLFAEANIVGGKGDPEQWSSLLAPSAYQQLKERVDLDFDPAAKERFADGETVSVDLHVKNVENLIVKIYEINTYNYFLNFGRQINTDLNLDGLVANEELSFDYEESPFKRVVRTFQFAQLNAARGVWVVEFIGNGKSSRALIRRGNLQYLTRTSTAGNVLRILDDKRQSIPGAFAWLNGKRYDQNEDGEVVIPFSNNPGTQQVILGDGQGFASLENLQLLGEQYGLAAGFYIDREELLARRDATLAVRPNFTLNGAPGDVALLENVVLTIVSTDLDGVQSTATVPDFKLFPHKESTHTLRVPNRLASLQFQMTAKVKSLSQNQDVQLAASDSLAINQIATTDVVSDLFLSKIDGKYRVQLLGRTGEPQKNTAVNVNLRRDDFRTDVRTTLKTDDAGSIDLGALEGIFRVTADAPNGRNYRWVLPSDKRRYPSTIHAKTGEVIAVPVVRGGEGREAFSLLETANGSPVKDYLDSISVKDGFATIRDLPAGDYALFLKEAGETVRIRVTAGQESNGFFLSSSRNLERRNGKALQIREVRTDGDDLLVRLDNANSHTRIHVITSRFVPAFSAFDTLGNGVTIEPLRGKPARYKNLYVSGRSIGDEYRYIIERRYAKKFPGNMLRRPGLLLNPWALRDTATGKDEAQEGQDWARGAEGELASLDRAPSETPARGAAGTADPHSIEFLADPGVVAFNLAPEANGELRIKLEELGDRQFVRVIAVDSVSAVERNVALPARYTKIQDLRLATGLNPKRHFTQRDQVSILEPNKAHTIDDISTAEFEAYDTIGSVYHLFKTLSGGNSNLDEFSFVIDWPEHDDAKKRELYSKHASHELSFFLQRKDPDFFAAVVQPYLANKKDKTFVDRYLLGNDLTPYLEPWRYTRLNIVERILLAGSLPDQKSSIARDVNDLLALLPPEQRLDLQNFETALAGAELHWGYQSGGAKGENKSLREQLKSVQKSKRASSARYKADMDGDGLELASAAAEPAPPSSEALGVTREAGIIRESLQKKSAELLGDIEEDAQLADKEVAFGRKRLSNRGVRDQLAELGVEAEEMESRAEFAGRRTARDRGRRADVRQFYRKLDETKEWAENNYYHLPIEQQNTDLVTVNKFWNDFAARNPEAPFYSKHISEVARNFTEMMFALSVLDLPFTAGGGEGSAALEKNRLTMKPTTPVILFHKETTEAAAAGQATQLLVSQNFFRQGDRFIDENGERSDKFVSDEFLTGVVYGCQIVVTNPTSSRQRLDLMHQIPIGSIPVNNSKATANAALRLEPYQTHTQDFFFYFPMAGDFPHFPVHVSKDQKVVAFAEPFTFHVVEELTNTDTSSWAYVSQWGTEDEVLAFLNQNNLRRLDLTKVAWRCRESDGFFNNVVEILDGRHYYDPVIFSYAVQHNVLEPMRQFLLHADGFLANCGAWIDTKLVTIDPVERKNYQHLEYSPLVNARTYALGGSRKVLNDRFRNQYLQLMRIFSYRAQLDAADNMTLTYYQLLQDRIDEALAAFDKVDRSALPTQLHYDYLKVYTSFFREDPGTARAVAEQYADYPVDRWQKVFHEVTAQLDEIEGKGTQLIDEENREQQQNQLAATEPALTFKVENRKVDLLYRNLKAVTVNYYRMDLEFLFSTNPFVSSDSARFSMIVPNRSDRVDLAAGTEKLTLDLPAEFEGENILVEVIGSGIRKASAYYSNRLNVQLAQNYGQLQVTHAEDSKKPLSKVYVKVYAEIGGTPRFYKDGYTDLRGKFDYASLNTSELDQVSRFSILVMSDEHGALVSEAKPPQR